MNVPSLRSAPVNVKVNFGATLSMASAPPVKFVPDTVSAEPVFAKVIALPATPASFAVTVIVPEAFTASTFDKALIKAVNSLASLKYVAPVVVP